MTSIVDQLQLRSEKLQSYQYDLDKMLKELERKEYIHSNINVMKSYESQARILEELTLSINPRKDHVKLVLGLEKNTWNKNSIIDYYSFKQKYLFLRRLYVLTILNRTIRKAPILDKKTSQKKGFNRWLRMIQQRTIQRVFSNYAITKFTFNRLQYKLLKAKLCAKIKIIDNNQKASLYHVLTKVIRGFRYIKENCYDKRSSLISKKTLKVLVLRHERYNTLKRSFNSIGCKVIQRKNIYRSIRKYRIGTLRKYFKYFITSLKYHCHASATRKIKRGHYITLMRAFNNLRRFSSRTRSYRKIQYSVSNISDKHYLLKYLYTWKNYYHHYLQKRSYFCTKIRIYTKMAQSKYLKLWRCLVKQRLSNRAAMASKNTRAKKFYLKNHGPPYLKLWMQLIKFQHPIYRHSNSKLKGKYLTKKRTSLIQWLNYTKNNFHYQRLLKRGAKQWRKQMLKRWIKNWILYAARSKVLKTRITSRIYNARKKSDKKRSFFNPYEKFLSTAPKKMDGAFVNGRASRYIHIKHMLNHFRTYVSSSSVYRNKLFAIKKNYIIKKKRNAMQILSHRLIKAKKEFVLTKTVSKRKRNALLLWYSKVTTQLRKGKLTSLKSSLTSRARKHSLFLRWRRCARKGIRLVELLRQSKRHSRKRILASYLLKLRGKVMIVTDQDAVVKTFYQRIINPIKLQRGFNSIYDLWDRKNALEADPRIHFHDQNLVAKYLSQWRDNYYYEKDLQDKVNNHLSIRAIVNELNAINTWRSICSDKYQYHICNRKADEFRNKVMMLPVFNTWRTVAYSCSYSIIRFANDKVTKYIKWKYWGRIRNRFLKLKQQAMENKTITNMRVIAMKRNILLFANKKFKGKMHKLFLLKAMSIQADSLRAKHLKNKMFNGIKKSVFAETAIYRKARQMWKTLGFKRARKYLTKIRRKTLYLTLAQKKYVKSIMTISIKRFKEWKLQKWRKHSYMRTELGDAKYTMMLVINSLKKWRRFVSISSSWNSSLVKTMMYLFHRVFVRLNANVQLRKKQKMERKKFLHNRKKWGFDKFLRYSYSGKYKQLLKKNKNRVKNTHSTVYYEQNNMFHHQYRLSFFGDFRVSKQRLSFEKAVNWRLIVKISKVFVMRLNDMKKSKRRNMKRFKQFKSYLLLREFYKWKDTIDLKIRRRGELLHLLKHFKKRKCLNRFHQYAHLKKLYRQLTNKIIKKRLIIWKLHKRCRIIAKKVIEKCLLRVNVSLVQARFNAWCDDVSFQKSEENKLKEFLMIRKNYYLTKLQRYSKLKRKTYIILRRFKGIKYSRTLKRVFVALMKHLEMKYKNQDKFKVADKFHQDFLRTYVLHRFFLLRRNRIAREYVLNKKNKLLLGHLLNMKRKNSYFKGLIAKSNRLFMKKGFLRLKETIILGKKAPKKKYVSRKVRAAKCNSLDKWRKRVMLRIGLHCLRSFIKKLNTFKYLYKDVDTYRDHRNMKKAIKAFLRNRRSNRRIRSSIKYLDKYHTEYTYTRTLKRFDKFACERFTMKVNVRLLANAAIRKETRQAFKKFIVKKHNRKRFESN